MRVRADKIRTEVAGFLSAPASPLPLAVLRVSLCVVLLGQGFSLAPEWLELFGRNGILSGEVVDSLTPIPPLSLGWLSTHLSLLGFSGDSLARAMFLAYLGSLASLAIGWRARLSAFVAWLTHFLLVISTAAFAYGVDHLANIFLFYLIWVPSGACLSVDRIKGRADGSPSRAARLGLRLIQGELAVIYLSSGLHKAAGIEWWNGEAIWRSVSLPLYGVMDMAWLAYFPWASRLACWATLIIEIGYGVFIWPAKTRRTWVGATLVLHLGIAVCLGLFSFAAVMAVLTVSAFAINAEPTPRPITPCA